MSSGAPDRGTEVGNGVDIYHAIPTKSSDLWFAFIKNSIAHIEDFSLWVTRSGFDRILEGLIHVFDRIVPGTDNNRSASNMENVYG